MRTVVVVVSDSSFLDVGVVSALTGGAAHLAGYPKYLSVDFLSMSFVLMVLFYYDYFRGDK